MNGLERWDIILRFIDGPLASRGDLVLLGPAIHVGANPGPDGLKLEGYRGLDDRQAVFTAYNGASVSVAPIGKLQVRVSPHEHVNWNEVQPIRGAVYLSNGDAIHLGPPGRGGTCIFVRAQRVGEWQRGAITSGGPGGNTGDPSKNRPSQVKQIKVNRGIPVWLIPTMMGMLFFTTMTVGILAFAILYDPPKPLGPSVAGQEFFDVHTQLDEYLATEVKAVKIDGSEFKGVEAAFEIFLMRDNARAAGWSKLEDDQKLWDQNLLDWVKRSVGAHAKAYRFWRRLDEVAASYAHVLGVLRKNDLPDVLAAIPYQESGYQGLTKGNLVCASGYWQFLPEIAHQADVPIRDCRIRGRPDVWNPDKAPPIGVIKNAIYINRGSKSLGCLIEKCEVDQRADLDASTDGAAKLLLKAYQDSDLRASGAVVQMVIASHNAGYDNSPYTPGNQKNSYNLRWSYTNWRNKVRKGQPRNPDFIGANLTCTVRPSSEEGYDPNARCNSEASLGFETQHYVHMIIAQHILAACFYGLNYPNTEEFAPYAELVTGGYCESFNIPTREELKKHGG